MSPAVIISKKIIIINSVFGLFVHGINITVFIWLQGFLLHRISTEEYSLLPIVSSIIIFLPLVSTILSSGIGRFATEEYAKNKNDRVSEIISSTFPVVFVVGIIILIIGIVFSFYLDSILIISADRLIDGQIMLFLLILNFVVSFIASPFTIGFFVRQKFVLLNMIGMAIEVLRLSILFILLFGVSVKILWVVVASVCASLVSVMARVIVSKRLVPALVFNKESINWKLTKEIVNFGGWNLLLQMSGKLRLGVDPIILNRLSTAYDVTCFHLGSMPYRQIENITRIARKPLMPQLTAMHAQEIHRNICSVFLRGGRYALWASLLLAIPIMVYSHEIVAIWVGEKFSLACIVMILLLAVYPIKSGNEMMGLIAYATNNIRPLAIRAIFTQLINLVLTIYLVGNKEMGAIGSALSTFIVMTCVYPFLTVPLGLRLGGVSIKDWFQKTLLPGWLPGIFGLIVWITLKYSIKPTNIYNLAGCIIPGAIVYTITLILCFQPEDRQDFNTLLKRVAKKNIFTVFNVKKDK